MFLPSCFIQQLKKKSVEHGKWCIIYIYIRKDMSQNKKINTFYVNVVLQKTKMHIWNSFISLIPN